jgi:hypothetical protein
MERVKEKKRWRKEKRRERKKKRPDLPSQPPPSQKTLMLITKCDELMADPSPKETKLGLSFVRQKV